MRHILILLCFGHLICSLLLIKTSDAAYRVDAHERAKRMVYHPSSPFQRRHLDKSKVTIRDLLGLNKYEEVEVSKRIETAEGSEVFRLNEKYLGVPVFDASLTVTVDRDGHLTGDATGIIIQGIENDLTSVKPKLSQLDVLHIALKAEEDEIYANENIDPTYKITIFLDNQEKSRLVYYMSYTIENEKEIKRPTFIIDGNTGEVLRKWNNLDTIFRELTGSGGNEKSGIYKFSEKRNKAFLTQIGETCFLENNYVKVIDMQNDFVFDSEYFNKTDPLYYPCNIGFNDTVNTASSPALDAFYFGSLVSQMFQEWFNDTILKDQAIMRVHFGFNFGNAFWDGKYCTFGDGDEMLYPLTDADIVGHELAHGFTEQHSGLIYYNQSGSINEAFSDITGEITEFYVNGNDWLIGYNIMKNSLAMRYMDDPTLDNISISHIDNFTEGTDPHFGSGIYNYIFYYIVHEAKMDIKEAYRVFLIANQIYWHPNTDFTSGACDMLKVAYDLGKDLTPFVESFELVGIKPCDVEKYVRRLSVNRTISGIKVAPGVNPVFDFIYPSWASNITINVSSICGKVNIKVSKSNMLTEGKNSSNPITLLAEGTSEVQLEKLDGYKIFIKLSPESTETLEHVDTVVTYSCAIDSILDSVHDYVTYSHICEGADYDYY